MLSFGKLYALYRHYYSFTLNSANTLFKKEQLHINEAHRSYQHSPFSD